MMTRSEFLRGEPFNFEDTLYRYSELEGGELEILVNDAWHFFTSIRVISKEHFIPYVFIINGEKVLSPKFMYHDLKTKK